MVSVDPHQGSITDAEVLTTPIIGAAPPSQVARAANPLPPAFPIRSSLFPWVL